MKKLLTLSLLVFGLTIAGSAQKLILENHLETTQVGTKIGGAIGMIFKGNYQVGMFHQEHSHSIFSGEKLPRFYEESFKGVYFSLPLKGNDFLELSFKVRTGIVNNEIFSIKPSIHSYIRPVKFIRLGLGIGTRMLRPTLMPSISILL